MTTRCQCERCTKKQPRVCNRLYKEDLTSADRVRYSDPRFWCQCGAWKYSDALGCEDCYREQEAYIDR